MPKAIMRVYTQGDLTDKKETTIKDVLLVIDKKDR